MSKDKTMSSSVKIIKDSRTGNHLFMYLMSQYIAEKHNLKFDFEIPDHMNLKDRFDINRYSGLYTHKIEKEINDENILDFLNTNTIDYNPVLHGFFQSPIILNNVEIQDCYKKYLIPKKIETDVSDIFIHIRLGDILNRHNLPYEYYRKCILKYTFTTGVIASDTPDHTIVKKLQQEFGFKVLLGSPIDTIWYGCQCKKIILSQGSFSFFIAFYSNNSEISYIDNPTAMKYFNITEWAPDIFSIFKDKFNLYGI